MKRPGGHDSYGGDQKGETSDPLFGLVGLNLIGIGGLLIFSKYWRALLLGLLERDNLIMHTKRRACQNSEPTD